MTANLIAELIKNGVLPKDAVKAVAEALNVSERTARNKINGASAWTLPEAMRINEVFFGGDKSIEYLFAGKREAAS